MQNSLEEHIGQLLKDQNKTLALAESCTGGLVGHLITQIPGSSDYLKGGVIAYSNEAKMQILGVEARTIDQYGAVSEETAIEMAEGARQLFSTDYAVAVTGIAGPASDYSEKPVGLTWVAVRSAGTTRTESHHWQGDRSENKALSAESALNLLLNILKGTG